MNDPIIKWDSIAGEECEAGATGSAALCFYSPFPPEVPGAQIVIVKNGQNICQGTIEGEFPLVCTVPTLHESWSGVKEAF